MLSPGSVDGLTIESLHLSDETFQWLTQTGSIKYDRGKGIRKLNDLLRHEATNLHWLPGSSLGRILEVKKMLALHDMRLAEPIIGPCLVTPDGDEWMRLPLVSSKPSWVLRSQLDWVDLRQLIGAPASALSHILGVHTIGSLSRTSTRAIVEDIDWKSRNMSGKRILRRLNHALEGLGLPPVR